MCLGEMDRWEFIISGDPIKEVGVVLDSASAGHAGITEDIFHFLNDTLECIPGNNFKIPYHFVSAIN